MITTTNICEAWVRLLHEVWEYGLECSPRGKRIKELLHTQVTVSDLRNNVLTHPLRDLNYRFMVAEWLWIQSGRGDVAWIERFNKKIAQFSDDGETFRGAYGPRLKLQIEGVLALLKKTLTPDKRSSPSFQDAMTSASPLRTCPAPSAFSFCCARASCTAS